jgi:hypothetical protein
MSVGVPYVAQVLPCPFRFAIYVLVEPFRSGRSERRTNLVFAVESNPEHASVVIHLIPITDSEAAGSMCNEPARAIQKGIWQKVIAFLFD